MRELRPRRRAIEEPRLVAHLRHDHRLAALHDLAGDALAEPVAHRLVAVDRARRRFDRDLAGRRSSSSTTVLRIGAVVVAENLEDPDQPRLEFARGEQRLADFQQCRKLANFRRVRIGPIGRRVPPPA